MNKQHLIGIALVVDDVRKGCKLAFRYPAPPPNTKMKINANRAEFHRLNAPVLAKLFRPKATALCNQVFELILDDIRYISYPVTVNDTTDTTFFNVILALNEVRTSGNPMVDEGGASDIHEVVVNPFREIVSQLAKALLHEQKRLGFVTQEVRTLLNVQDELQQLDSKKHSTTSPSTQNTNGSESSHTIEIDQQTTIDVAMERSVLANNLKDIYHGLNESGTVFVVINNWIRLSLTQNSATSSSYVFGSSVAQKDQPIRPYHTLLLQGEEERIIESLPNDCSPQLQQLIRAANPLKSFQELHIEIGLPLHQVFRLANHLVYWGIGRIIVTLTKHNIYQVSPTANIQSQSALALEFRRKFPPQELHEILANFRAAKRLSEYLRQFSSPAQIRFMNIVIWLLQHDLVIQLHRYVHLNLPTAETPYEEALFEGYESPQETSDRLEICESDGLSKKELAYLETIATNGPIHALLKRLVRYFRGQHHIEEIMWRENITRAELNAVLTAYNGIAVCCLHE